MIDATIKAAEQFADDALERAELSHLQEAAENLGYPRERTTDPVFSTPPFRLARAASLLPRYDDGWLYYDHMREVIRETTSDGRLDSELAHAELLRDIFGNPFRPLTFDPAWLTSDVLALAHGIYEERAFDRVPILADALQDAGCDNTDILSHCRSEGAHVRGCWVVDLVLGKS